MHRLMRKLGVTMVGAALLCVVAPTFAAKPALTQDVDNPARNGVTANCSPIETLVTAPDQYEFHCLIYTVPAGRIFVLETVSGLLQTFAGTIQPQAATLTAPDRTNFF